MVFKVGHWVSPRQLEKRRGPLFEPWGASESGVGEVKEGKAKRWRSVHWERQKGQPDEQPKHILGHKLPYRWSWGNHFTLLKKVSTSWFLVPVLIRILFMYSFYPAHYGHCPKPVFGLNEALMSSWCERFKDFSIRSWLKPKDVWASLSWLHIAVCRMFHDNVQAEVVTSTSKCATYKHRFRKVQKEFRSTELRIYPKWMCMSFTLCFLHSGKT